MRILRRRRHIPTGPLPKPCIPLRQIPQTLPQPILRHIKPTLLLDLRLTAYQAKQSLPVDPFEMVFGQEPLEEVLGLWGDWVDL